MNWKDLVEIGGNIATMGAMIVSIFTIREMGKDRKASRQPELVLRNNDRMILLDELGLKTKWINSSIYYNEGIEYGSNQCYLNMENIGLGIAKDIEIEWIFDYKLFKSMIIKSGSEFKNNRFGNSQILEWCPTDEVAVCVTMDEDDDRGQLIEFLSANQENIYKERIYIPKNYCSMFSSLLSIEKEQEDFTRFTLETPKLICQIKYHDVGGVKYIKKYELKFELFNALPKNVEIIGDDIVFQDGCDGLDNIPGVTVKIVQV